MPFDREAAIAKEDVRLQLRQSTNVSDDAGRQTGTIVSDDAGRQTRVVILEAGEEAFAALTRFANEVGITAASLTAIGAFENETIGRFELSVSEDLIRKMHRWIHRWRLANVHQRGGRRSATVKTADFEA
jgi:hypothetical protein